MKGGGLFICSRFDIPRWERGRERKENSFINKGRRPGWIRGTLKFLCQKSVYWRPVSKINKIASQRKLWSGQGGNIPLHPQEPIPWPLACYYWNGHDLQAFGPDDGQRRGKKGLLERSLGFHWPGEAHPRFGKEEVERDEHSSPWLSFCPILCVRMRDDSLLTSPLKTHSCTG